VQWISEILQFPVIVERRRPVATLGGSTQWPKRYFGNIYRSFTLPVELDESACEAKYDNGVLELKLVTKAAAPGKRLAIQ